MAPSVVLQDVHKSFGDVDALRGLNLSVEEGEIHGLLGPNGAGKTTAIKILSTLLTPDDGRAEIDGVNVVDDPRRVRGMIALTGQNAAVDERLTGRENLMMIGRLFRLSHTDTKAGCDDLLNRFDLEDAAGRKVSTYSGGMRRRLDLAASMMSKPRVVFLDEPTTGLDPRARLTVWEMIASLPGDGVTVILTTQSLEEADKLSDRLTVIDAGQTVATGTPSELKSQVGGDRVAFDVDDGDAAQLAEVLREQLATDDVSVEGRVVTAAWAGDSLADLVLALREQHIAIDNVQVRSLTLDDVFLSLTGKPAERDDEDEEETA